jgi:hypothetical protein
VNGDHDRNHGAKTSLAERLEDDFGGGAGVADRGAAGAGAEFAVEAEADFGKEAPGTDGGEGGYAGKAVKVDEALFEAGGSDKNLLAWTLELGRGGDGEEGTANLGEVGSGGESGADAVLGPFMLDEAAAGHDVEHGIDFAGGGWGERGGAELRPAALVLGPEPMGDEAEAA